jgi:hypothetical protein
MENYMKKIMLLITLIVLSNNYSYGQIKLGADIFSRYIWRGLDFGDAPALQPSLTYTIGGLSIGAGGSYAFPTANTTYSENDLWASYLFTTQKVGAISILITDYYIPSAGMKFGFYKPTSGETGAAHTIEGGLNYLGPSSFPIALAFYTNLSNDPDNSSYIQISYPFTVGEATVSLGAGFVPLKSAYYLTDSAGFTNIFINAAKSITISDKFLLPINVSYIANPALDITYLVFGASLTF